MEDYVLNTFKALKSKVSGFDKTEQQFRDLVTNDPAYRANVHKALTEKVDGFSRTSEEFDSLVGVKKKDISGSGDPALQSFEGQTPSQSTVSGEINVGDVPQVPVSKTPQVPGTGEIKEGVLTHPPKPKSPEELNLEMQSKVLGKDIPKDLVETAKITTDKSQLHNIAYALLKNNKTAAANAVSDIILQKFPDDSYAHQIKAYNFEVEKDYVNSAKELTKAIEKSPDDKSLYAKRAIVARSAGMETTAKEDAQAYLRLAKLPNGDEDEALTRSNMYMLAGDEKQAQYWKKNYEGLVQDRHRGNTAQNLIGLHDWVLSGIDKISKPLQIPGDMIVEGVRKVAEGLNEDSMPKRISGLIDAGFGVLMATPAGVVFNSAITAGELVGAGEVTEWAFAPISKALNLAGIDEKQVGSILKAGLSPTAPISEKTANAWGDLAVQIGNLLPFMLFSHGIKYAKTADKLTKREPLNATDLKNVDEVIASSAENPQSMNESVKLAEQFIKDKKDEEEVSEVQKSMGAIPTYRIGSKLYPTPESFLKRLQDIKDKGVENINYEINLDPETSGKALDIFKEKNTPADEVPNGSEKKGTGMGELEQERQARLAEIDSEIKRLNVEKKNESDRIDKANANIELPLDVAKDNELFNVEQQPVIADLSEYDSKIRALENERNTLISKEKQVAEADNAQGDLLKQTPDTVQSLQEDLAAKRITLQEYQKRIEQVRKDMPMSIKDRADELAARIKKSKDSLDGITMMAILPYQKQIMRLGIDAAAEAVRLGGTIAEAVQKGIVKIRELCREKSLSVEEENKLIKKFENLPHWVELDSKKVQKDIDETVGVRNKLKKEYRDLKDKLFQAENRLRGKTKTEAFEKGASSRDKEVSKLKNKEGKERAELETMDDVRKNISDIVESNKEVIRKLTGQKTGTLIRKINNATTYRDLEKVINYIEKVTTDIEFRETANDIASLQKEISSLIKKNEYSKGVGKGYLGWAKEIANIPKAKLADLSGQMLNDLKNIAEELSRNKVSNVENVQKFFDDYRNEMDKIFAESNIEKVVSSESMSGLIGNVEKLTKIDPLAINTIEDIIQLKRNLSLIKNKIDRLMVQEDISYRDGKFYDKDGNVIDKYSDLAKSYDDASVGSTVQGLFTKLNDVGIKDLSESLLETAEQNARKQWIDNSNENWKHIDWDNFTPEQKEVIEWLKSNVRDKSIDGLSLGELDTYVKVVEQLTYGNLPRKLIEVASSIDVLKKASIIDTDFINIIRASSEKEKYIKKHLYGEDNKGKLFKDISWKKDMTDIDEKYGIANKHRHPVFEIFNDALLKPIEFLNRDRDVLFHIALGKSPFVSGKFKSVTKQRLADREVNALRVMLAWQANIPDAKVEKIMKNTGLSREQVLSYWEISESEWGKRYVADAKNSKGYDAETIKLDREAYQNIKKRNGGNLILFDLAKEDQQILEDVSRLLSKDQYQFLTDLYEGYESQKHKMKVNAVKRNIPFSELRFYDPFFIFDKPVDDAGNAQQFIDAALLDRTAPHTKSGNVNERTFDYHISKMGATDKFRQYTLTNLLNYYMADPLYHTVRALNTLKNKTEKTLTPGESEKSYLTTDEVQIVSELAEGLRTRFTNVYATKVNRGVGSRILLKAVGTMAKMGRVSLLDPTRLIKDTAGNQLTALGQLPVSQWGGYMDKIIKLNPQENKTLDVLHSETGFREAERYYSEYSDSNEATKKGLYVLSFNDRATQKRIFLNEFEHAFHEFSGSEFNADRWLTESEYKSANMDAFTKASAEAKWMAYDTFPSMEKIVKKRQGEGAGTIMLNFMQTWQIRESLRFLKQAKNFTLNTNEGRAEASKKIGLFLTSQTAFATIGVAQAAGLTWLASQAVSLWDEETAEKLKANSKKTIERITSPSFWATQGVSGVVQLTMGSFANLNRAAQITGLMIVNSAYPANKKPDWLKNLNDYAQAVFYVKPIETNGYTDASRNMDAILQYSMAAQSMLQMSKASGLSLYEISKKVMAGESLSKSEYDAWNLARGAHLILATMYGYPGAGTVDKLMTRVSNANRKKKSSSRPSVHR